MTSEREREREREREGSNQPGNYVEIARGLPELGVEWLEREGGEE